MPRRAIFSLLIALTGTLIAPAASVGTDQPSARFQPSKGLKATVLRPAAARVILPGTQTIKPKVTRIVPVQLGARAPAIMKPALSVRHP